MLDSLASRHNCNWANHVKDDVCFTSTKTLAKHPKTLRPNPNKQQPQCFSSLRNNTPNGQRLVGFLQRPRFGTTLLGCVPGNEQVSVEWTFTNTSPEAWPVGCRLRYLGGNVKPIYTSKSTTEVILPRGTNNQTPACVFFFVFSLLTLEGMSQRCFLGDFLDGDLWLSNIHWIYGSWPERFGQCNGLTAV